MHKTKTLMGFLISIVAILFPIVSYASTSTTDSDSTYPVGISQVEYTDPARDNRPIVMLLFYPASTPPATDAPFIFPFYKKLGVTQ